MRYVCCGCIVAVVMRCIGMLWAFERSKANRCEDIIACPFHRRHSLPSQGIRSRAPLGRGLSFAVPAMLLFS